MRVFVLKVCIVEGVGVDLGQCSMCVFVLKVSVVDNHRDCN